MYIDEIPKKEKKKLILSGCKKINDIYFSKEIWKEKTERLKTS